MIDLRQAEIVARRRYFLAATPRERVVRGLALLAILEAISRQEETNETNLTNQTGDNDEPATDL
jgi:hypothetical protein